MVDVEDVKDLALKASDYFYTKKMQRDEEKFFLKDNAPTWVKDLVKEAHGDMLPDDWKYRKIHGILANIPDYDDPEEYKEEIVDGLIDIYYHDIFGWLSSNTNRMGYFDQYVEEMGMPAYEDNFLSKACQLGQYMELNEMYGIIWNALEEEADV